MFILPVDASRGDRCRDLADLATAGRSMLGGVPDLRVAVEHVASPHDPSPGGMKIWETGLASLADLPGVNVKVSALQWLDPS